MQKFRKLLAGVLAGAMTLSLVPAMVLAEETDAYAADSPETAVDLAEVETPDEPAALHIHCVADPESARVGETVTVTISTDAMKVANFTGGLQYDNTLLEVVSVAGNNDDVPAPDENTHYAKLTGTDSAAELPLTVTEGEDTISVYSDSQTEVQDWNAEEALVTVTFKAINEGTADFTVYEDSDGAEGTKAEKQDASVELLPEEYITYIQADGTETPIKSSVICSVDATEAGNYLLSDVLSAVGITADADCAYEMVGSGDYTVDLDADYFADMALYYNGGWRDTMDTNAPEYVGGWYKVSGLTTIREIDHDYAGAEGCTHSCVNPLSSGKNSSQACAAEEEHITYLPAEGEDTKIYSCQIESTDKTANDNYLLSDVLSAVGITAGADCAYEMVGSGDYTVDLDADYFADMALYYNGGWRDTMDTNAPEYVGGWYKVSGLTTIREINHVYGDLAEDDSHSCCNLLSTGKTSTVVCGTACTGIMKTETVPATTKTDGTVTVKCDTCGKVKSEQAVSKVKSAALSCTAYVYNGKVKTPAVTVTDSQGKKLVKNTDYTVKYASGRKAVGSYKVTITLKGKYKGTITKSFKINPKATAIKSVSNSASRAMTVKWSKVSGVTGYQIRYYLGGKYKTVTVKGYRNVSSVIKKLTKGKTYKVYVRTYKKVSSVNYYSKWSSRKSCKIKK